MSRWLWALLGGVVLVAIAAVFWTASNQTNVTPPVSPGPAPVAPAPVAKKPAPSSAPAPAAQKAAPSPPPSPAPPAAQEAAAPPVPAPPAPTAPPAPLRPPMGTASRLTACSRAVPHDALRSARRRAGTFAAACSRSARRSAPAAARARTGGAGSRRAIYAPKSLAQLVGAWAYSAEDCERLFERRGGGWAYRQPVDKFAQAAIVESPKKILLPSATCQIERRV